VGAISLPKPARRARRGQQSGTLTGPRSTSSRGELSQSGELLVGAHSTSNVHARGAIVEAMSDAALVELVLAGDQDAFSLLVERYKDAVQNLAYRMLSNVTEAEDVTQEAFVRAYTQLGTYKPAHKFSTWLLSIASHLAIDQLRRRRFLALPLEDVPFLEWIVDVGTGPEQSALAGEQQDEIQHYLRRLPSKYRGRGVALLVRFFLRGNRLDAQADTGTGQGSLASCPRTAGSLYETEYVAGGGAD